MENFCVFSGALRREKSEKKIVVGVGGRRKLVTVNCLLTMENSGGKNKD
jgi:hypothetical protein